MELSWHEPENKNGLVNGYRIFYMHSNFTDVNSLKTNNESTESTETIEFLLNNLSKYKYHNNIYIYVFLLLY